jgi:hypothetical protein
MYPKRPIVLVLPHTFFLDGYRHYERESALSHIENLSKVTLIAEIIARKKAFYPSELFAATSDEAFRRFESKLGEMSYFSRLNLTAIREALTIDTEESLNKLKPIEETIVAVADKLLKTDAVNPIIVVRNDSVNKWKNTYTKDFYKRHTSRARNIAIFSLDDTLRILKEKENELYDQSIKSITDGILVAVLKNLKL